jgi:hypothetical protein
MPPTKKTTHPFEIKKINMALLTLNPLYCQIRPLNKNRLTKG